MEGEAVDLERFPAPLWHAEDGGRYIGTGTAVATIDPDEHWVNLGAYRSMLVDRNHVTINIVSGKHGRTHMDKWMAREGRAPIAIHIGMDPLYMILAGVEVPTGISELNYAGAVRGEPVKVVRSTVTGLPIIASAEIVIEGWVVQGELADEGLAVGIAKKREEPEISRHFDWMSRRACRYDCSVAQRWYLALVAVAPLFGYTRSIKVLLHDDEPQWLDGGNILMIPRSWEPTRANAYALFAVKVAPHSLTL